LKLAFQQFDGNEKEDRKTVKKSVSLNVPYFSQIDSGQFGQGTESQF